MTEVLERSDLRIVLVFPLEGNHAHLVVLVSADRYKSAVTHPQVLIAAGELEVHSLVQDGLDALIFGVKQIASVHVASVVKASVDCDLIWLERCYC